MQTPTSGTPNVSLNLGDTSKLDFLKDIPMDDEKPETPAASAATMSGQVDDESATVETPAAPAAGVETSPEDDDTGEVKLGAAAEIEDNPAPPTTPPRNPDGTVSAKKGVRDYSDIAPEHVGVFKQMSDQAYTAVKEWYKNQRAAQDIESKYTTELEELRNYKFYQHPEAYKLSPEYNTAATNFRTQATVIDHWTKQLERLEAGEPIQDIGIDEKGNVVAIPGEIPASPAMKARVAVALQQAMARQGQAQTELESLSTKYQTKSKEFDTFLDNATNQLVSPELLSDATFKKYHDTYLNKVIPGHLQNVPVYRQMAKMAAFIQVAANQIKALQARTKTTTIKQQAARQQGPGDGHPANGTANLNDRSMADVLKEFEALRR